MAITGGPSLNSVPAPQQVALSTNYIDFTSGTNDWSQQYLPDLMEKEAEVFGPRTISGFLSKVGAEEAMQSDQVVWSEQGRLHLSYTGKVAAAGGVNVNSIGAASQITLQKNIDGVTITSGGATANHGVRVNDTIIVADSVNGVVKCLVIKVNDNVIDVSPYTVDNLSAQTTDNATTILVYGSEYAKGTSYFSNATTDAFGNSSDSRTANEPDFKSFSNKPIIMKDYYEVSGSDASRIGWVEVAAEAGQSGYLWYLKAEADTRARFTDYLEMAMLEAVKDGTSHADEVFIAGSTPIGSQGLFDAIEDRGNITSGVTGVNAATDLAEFDAILAEFDKQGAIEEYMMFVNRATSLAVDDMLASMNSYGAGGTSYGVFDNSEDMALNLGFSGFRRGSYDFYKSDFTYLNDLATRGGINAAAGANAIRGVMIPAGVTTVYDQQMGKNLKRPFLHVRYRASQTDNRKMKTWTTGSVGAATSALDAMQIHFLSERCLITQGANNFMLMK
jgi:hypothetical protein